MQGKLLILWYWSTCQRWTIITSMLALNSGKPLSVLDVQGNKILEKLNNNIQQLLVKNSIWSMIRMNQTTPSCGWFWLPRSVVLDGHPLWCVSLYFHTVSIYISLAPIIPQSQDTLAQSKSDIRLNTTPQVCARSTVSSSPENRNSLAFPVVGTSLNVCHASSSFTKFKGSK